MRLQEIIGIVREYFFLALTAVIVLGIIFFLVYFIGNKKFSREGKALSKRKLLLVAAFVGYVIMVVGVTFLNRGSHYEGGIDLSLFASYREAWYSSSVRAWQFIYLNILMFVPFGVLFPLLHTRFRKAFWTIGMAALFTLAIESLQLVTGFGIFDADDLFNNLLGAIIGYGIVMGIIALKAKGIKRALVYFSPLLLVVILSGSMLAYYHLKEFGNLSIVPVHKTDMTEATTTIDVELNDKRMTVPVYKAPSYTKAAADEFIVDFFKRMGLETSNIEDNSYPDTGIYWIRGETSYNISFQFLDGSYRYTDFSSFDEEREPKDEDEKTLKESLKKFDIHIPQDSHFQKIDTGTYQWTVDKKSTGNRLIDGSLVVDYYNDDSVKSIDNKLITYDKVRDIEIKSEQEAYQEVLDGKFLYFPKDKKINTLHIDQVEVSYQLDSKGYYQPVYAFHGVVDGTDMTILIPGI